MPDSPSAPLEDMPRSVREAAKIVLDRKAADVLVLDLRGISSSIDAFLIASGNSDIHVRAIAEHLLETLKERGLRAGHVEGLEGGRWVLIDYFEFVAHIFHPSVRDFYRLEELWGDAHRTVFQAEE